MSSKYKNKRRVIHEKLIYQFVCIFELSYFKCKANTFYLGQPSYPGKVFTWKIFIPPRRVTQLHHVNSHPGLLLVSIIAGILPLLGNSPPCKQALSI